MKRILIGAVTAIAVCVVILAYLYLIPGNPRTIPFTPDSEKNIADANILFVGDMFFDRHIRKTIETVGADFVFSCIYPLLSRADFVVGNLEGPITDNASVSSGTTPENLDHFRFTFPPSVAESLKRNNISVVSLGNNHIANFGREGIQRTKEYLDASGVAYFGGLSGDEPVYRKDAHGIPLSFVSYNQFGGSSDTDVADVIRLEKSVGRTVLVYAHWGEEYSSTTPQMKVSAKLFAEAGARAIIGSHPHVVLEREDIGNTVVYYSLGNFIFDQYWNDDVSHGRAVLLHIPVETDRKISITEYSTIAQTDGRVCEGVPYYPQ
ncbi:CapA family protein [Patescibacteria group bacterium]|nr:CapA family protein [Patescibacteria group bacterium]